MIKAAGALILYLLTATVVGKKIVGKYTLMDGSTCSGGQFFIENSARCQTAAIVLGLSDTDLYSGSRPDYPYGCYDYKDGVVFNSVGSEAAQDNLRVSICSSEASPPVEIVDQYTLMNKGRCISPSRYIESLAECASAATALDLGDVTPQIGVSTNKPHGCYYYPGSATNQLWFNTNSSKTSNTTDYLRVSLCSSRSKPTSKSGGVSGGHSTVAIVSIVIGVIIAAASLVGLYFIYSKQFQEDVQEVGGPANSGTSYVEMHENDSSAQTVGL
jgi:hypothetical protein